MVSRIAPKLAQASCQEHKFRLSVVANEKRLLIFSTALSETPEFLRRVLLKIQIIRDMMLCQRAGTDRTYERSLLPSSSGWGSPRRTTAWPWTRKNKDRSKRREELTVKTWNFVYGCGEYRPSYTREVTTKGFMCSCECWHFCGTRRWIIKFGWTSERQVSCKSVLRFSVSSTHTDGRTGAHVWQGTHLEDVVVEENHDDAGDIERGQGWIYDEVAVVEEAEILAAVGGVVQAEDDGAAYSSGNDPDEGDGQPHAAVILVFGVLYGLRHCDVPVSTQTNW